MTELTEAELKELVEKRVEAIQFLMIRTANKEAYLQSLRAHIRDWHRIDSQQKEGN